jgi:hypothetical protein
VARLSLYVSRHLNVHGHYSFKLPELAPPVLSGLLLLAPSRVCATVLATVARLPTDRDR